MPTRLEPSSDQLDRLPPELADLPFGSPEFKAVNAELASNLAGTLLGGATHEKQPGGGE